MHGPHIHSTIYRPRQKQPQHAQVDGWTRMHTHTRAYTQTTHKCIHAHVQQSPIQAYERTKYIYSHTRIHTQIQRKCMHTHVQHEPHPGIWKKAVVSFLEKRLSGWRQRALWSKPDRKRDKTSAASLARVSWNQMNSKAETESQTRRVNRGFQKGETGKKRETGEGD